MDRSFPRVSVDPEYKIQRAEARQRGDQQDSGDRCGHAVPLMSEREVKSDACEGDAGKQADDNLYVGDISFHTSKILFTKDILWNSREK